jgi:cyclopropane fatty-acyl-phospholipid synthase-like methyltransferase
MNRPAAERNVWDAGIWSLVRSARFDFMTRYIMEHILSAVSLRGKSVLELGAGTGRIAFLALRHGARKVTLVDSSDRAIALSRDLFRDEPADAYEIRKADILGFEAGGRHDVVVSSGVIEHFRGRDRERIIASHLENAAESSVIVHPTATRYAAFFNRFFLSRRLYGYQESFTEEEIDRYIARNPGVGTVRHVRFHPFYTVPGLHNFGWLNRYLDGRSCGARYGGLTLTHVTKTGWGTR